MSKDLIESELDQERSVEQELEDQLLGKTLAGRYKIKSVIGNGGWGRVYLADHLTLEIPVAIKVIHQHIASDQDRLKRLDQEAKILSRLNSPYLVKTMDYGLSPVAFLVMEFVEGETLSDCLSNKGSLNLAESIDLFEQLCLGLGEAHKLGLVHRDLKPGNILISRKDGQLKAKILDFGIAKVIDDATGGGKLTSTGEILGSPAYMSPEQWTARPVDQRSDIYALGCLMYEVLSGSPAFHANNSFEYLNLHIAQDLKPFSKSAPDKKIPQALELLVRKCAQKDPADRYLSTDAIIADLQAIRSGKTIQIKLPKYKADRSQSKNKTPIIVAIALTVLIGTASGVAYFKREEILVEVCSSLNHTADQQQRQDKFDDAIRTRRQAVQLAEYLPKQNKERLRTLRALSKILKEHGSFAESEELTKKIKEEIGDVQPVGIKNFLVMAVRESDANHNYPQAIKLANGACKQAEDIGKHTIIYSKCLQILGSIYREQRRLPTAEKILSESLKIAEDLMDPGDIGLAGRLNDLGLSIGRQGRSKEAEAAYLRAIKIGEAGKDPELGRYYNNLATSYLAQKDYDKAIAMSKHAYDVDLSTQGGIASNIMNNMGVMYFQKKEYAKALECFNKVWEIWQTDGRNHAQGSGTGEEPHINMSHVYRQMKDYDKAIACLQKALDFKIKNKASEKSIAEVRKLIASCEEARKSGKPSSFSISNSSVPRQ